MHEFRQKFLRRQKAHSRRNGLFVEDLQFLLCYFRRYDSRCQNRVSNYQKKSRHIFELFSSPE
jgi:hypothetical protein